MKNIEVPALARVEGEGGLFIGIKDGKAVEIRLDIYEPPRFFEVSWWIASCRKCPTSLHVSVGSVQWLTR